MNKYIYFLLTMASFLLIYGTNYKWNWLQHQHWIIPALVVLALIAGLWVRKKTNHKNLAEGLIIGSLVGLLLLAGRIIGVLSMASGM